MKALVTGGAGFTGAALCRRLHSAGHAVTALHQRPSDTASALQTEGIATVLGSVTDAELMNRLAGEHDVIYHIAAAFRRVAVGESAYWDVNVGGTKTVMEAALSRSVKRVVHCSTIGVHGHVADPPAREDAPIAPGDYYQESKWEGEKIARSFIDRGLPLSIVRPGSIYGPGDMRVFRMFKQVNSGRFFFAGDGEAHMHMVFIENLVDGIVLAGEHPDAVGKAFIIADAHSTPMRELVERTANALGVKVRRIHIPFWPVYFGAAAIEFAMKPLPMEPPIHRRRAKMFRQNRSFDISHARNVLGYAPGVSLDEGLRRTAKWYRAQGLLT